MTKANQDQQRVYNRNHKQLENSEKIIIQFQNTYGSLPNIHADSSGKYANKEHSEQR